MNIQSYFVLLPVTDKVHIHPRSDACNHQMSACFIYFRTGRRPQQVTNFSVEQTEWEAK